MMSAFTDTLKNLWSDGVRVVNKAATSVANATRYKMTEMDSVSRRREAISELGEKAYSLAQAGVVLPEELMPLVNEILALDEGLTTLHNDRDAAKAAAKEQAAVEKAARAEERAAQKAARAEERAALKTARAEAKAAQMAAQAAAANPVIEIEPAADTPIEFTGEAPSLEVAEEIVVEAEEIRPNVQ